MAANRDVPFVGSVKAQKAIVVQNAQIYDSAPWVPTEQDVAKEIVKELENRRVLYNDYAFEIPEQVVQSVLEMREFFHRKLIDTRQDGALANRLRAMRAACRKFLDTAGDGVGRVIIQDSFHGGPRSWAFFSALGELRSTIGLNLGLMLAAYKLTVEPELARILPANPAEDGA